MDLGQQRILQGAEQRSGDNHCPQAPSRGHPDHDRPEDKASEQDRRHRDEDARDGNPGLQKIDQEERGAAVQRHRMNAVMQVEKIDGAVAKERHRMSQD